MTVIAWDGKTLAADKMVTFGYAQMTVTKIERIGSSLVAIAGCGTFGETLKDWLRNGAEPGKYPEANRNGSDTHATMIVVREDASVWFYGRSPHPNRIESVPCAFGVGAEAALGAFQCGADSRKAVEAASVVVSGCGMGVDTLTLD